MRLPVVMLGLLAACADDTAKLEERVAVLEKRLANTGGERDALERKLDTLMDEVARLRRGADDVQARPTPPKRPEPDRSKTYAVKVEGSPVDGPADAKVTMVWALEYACPYCERVRPTVQELRKKYGKDLRVVYQHLIVHPATATASAYASCAAGRQGKFAQMDELLWERSFKPRKFDAMDCWRSHTCTVMEQLAFDAGVEVVKFRADMASCEAPVKEQMAELGKLGARGTPAFFINGRFLSGAQPLAAFEALIDEELAKANARIAQGATQRMYYEEWVLLNGEKMLAP